MARLAPNPQQDWQRAADGGWARPSSCLSCAPFHRRVAVAHISMMFVCAIYAEGAASLRFCKGG